MDTTEGATTIVSRGEGRTTPSMTWICTMKKVLLGLGMPVGVPGAARCQTTRWMIAGGAGEERHRARIWTNSFPPRLTDVSATAAHHRSAMVMVDMGLRRMTALRTAESAGGVTHLHRTGFPLATAAKSFFRDAAVRPRNSSLDQPPSLLFFRLPLPAPTPLPTPTPTPQKNSSPARADIPMESALASYSRTRQLTAITAARMPMILETFPSMHSRGHAVLRSALLEDPTTMAVSMVKTKDLPLRVPQTRLDSPSAVLQMSESYSR